MPLIYKKQKSSNQLLKASVLISSGAEEEVETFGLGARSSLVSAEGRSPIMRGLPGRGKQSVIMLPSASNAISRSQHLMPA